MRLAVVIPTLDEEQNLRQILPRVKAFADEICVSDGGSQDATVEVAKSFGVEVVEGLPGRGGQLNRGAARCSGEILIFLHADTLLPESGPQMVRECIAAGVDGGGFLVHYDHERPALRLGNRLINLRTRLTGCPLGDQAQFMTREAFTALGGFRDWPILEDLDLIRRLKRHGRTQILPAAVVTSARRFDGQGILRTTATNWLIWALYFVGVPPQRLARLYRNLR